MLYILSEIKNRSIVLLISVTIFILSFQIIINKIILFIIHPLCTINIDLYNKVSYNIIKKAFDVFDTTNEIKKNMYQSYTEQIDYVPSFEISLPINNINNIYILLLMLIIIYLICPIITYQIFIFILSSAYIHEKKIYKKRFILMLILWITPLILTHFYYIPIYINNSFHNYQEYNYYEIDIEFNIDTYLKKYFTNLFLNIITIQILYYSIKKKNIHVLQLFIIIIILLDILHIPICILCYIIIKELNIIKNLIIWR